MAHSNNSVLCCLLLVGTLVASAGVAPWRAPEAGVRTISLTRVVRIPVTKLNTQETAATVGGDVGTLTLSAEAPDEPPEGPNGFDVVDDGSFLVTDPLRRRIAVFDSQGKFRQEWKIGFAADSVTVIPSSLILVREASTGQLHAFDGKGQSRPAEGAALPEPETARLLSATRGSVTRSAGGTSGVLEVQLDKPGLRLLSLQSLATDREGNTYVALETTAGGETTEGINLNKYVRKYSKDGKLVCEITDIPLDYYVRPVDELRVHQGIVYQLMTTNSEVRINVWDTH